jgi:hypothetical protein
MLGSLVFRESANKSGEAGFMVLVIEPSLMLSLKRSLHWEFQEAATRASLKTHTPNNLVVFSARLVFQEEIILKQCKAWGCQ